MEDRNTRAYEITYQVIKAATATTVVESSDRDSAMKLVREVMGPNLIESSGFSGYVDVAVLDIKERKPTSRRRAAYG